MYADDHDDRLVANIGQDRSRPVVRPAGGEGEDGVAVVHCMRRPDGDVQAVVRGERQEVRPFLRQAGVGGDDADRGVGERQPRRQ